MSQLRLGTQFFYESGSWLIYYNNFEMLVDCRRGNEEGSDQQSCNCCMAIEGLMQLFMFAWLIAGKYCALIFC